MRRYRRYEDIRRDFPEYFPHDCIRCQKCGQVNFEYKSDRFRSFMIPHMSKCFSDNGLMRKCFEWGKFD